MSCRQSLSCSCRRKRDDIQAFARCVYHGLCTAARSVTKLSLNCVACCRTMNEHSLNLCGRTSIVGIPLGKTHHACKSMRHMIKDALCGKHSSRSQDIVSGSLQLHVSTA